MEKHNITLAYHSIGMPVDKTAGAQLYCVSCENFRQQMDYLSRGVNAVITFDDGDITNYTKAYPLLKERGLKAYFFIICELVGAPGYMNWKQIKELRDSGMMIGSHGMTHRVLTILKDNELEYEFSVSKKVLEDNLGGRIDTISLPRGLYNNRVMDKVKVAGYKKVFTSDATDSNEPLVGRISVRSGWNIGHFTNVVNNGPSFIDRTKELIKNSARKVMGDRNYDKIRSGLLR